MVWRRAGRARLARRWPAAFCVGVDYVAVAGIDDLHFAGGQICDLVLEIEHAFRSETMKHRNFTDRARPRNVCRPDNSMPCRSVTPRNGDIGTVELVPIGTRRLTAERCQADEGQVHPSGVLRLVVAGCHCNAPFHPTVETRLRRLDLLIVQQVSSMIPWEIGAALRTNPAPRTLRMMRASFGTSILRRSRPI